MPARLWRTGAALVAPFLPCYLTHRVRRGKEIAGRLPERYGEGAARPEGPLLWLHAASVGETLSLLPVLEALARRAPELRFLVTTGTVTSAQILQRRAEGLLASGRMLHRFAPLDVPSWCARFLDGWRPDAGAFVESELWPNLLAEARARGLPLALVNGRLSPRSARWWARAPGLAREVLGGFRLVVAQSEADAARFRAIGAPSAASWGNLKAAAPPLPADAAELERLRHLIGGRPVFLAASTHPGEEAQVAAAHRRLVASGRLPDLLTIVAPRHPERGPDVAAELAAAGAVARRAAGEDPGPDFGFYVADTLGELGLFYRLAGVALVGGSLVPHGGQNPLEPARLGCPVLLGPHTWNFEEPVARLLAAGGALRVAGGPGGGGGDGATLADAVAAVLSDGDRARAMADAAATVADDHAGLPDRMAAALLDLLRPGPGLAGDGTGRTAGGVEGRGPVEA